MARPYFYCISGGIIFTCLVAAFSASHPGSWSPAAEERSQRLSRWLRICKSMEESKPDGKLTLDEYRMADDAAQSPRGTMVAVAEQQAQWDAHALRWTIHVWGALIVAAIVAHAVLAVAGQKAPAVPQPELLEQPATTAPTSPSLTEPPLSAPPPPKPSIPVAIPPGVRPPLPPQSFEAMLEDTVGRRR